MEKRGYRISDEIKEQVRTGKYQTLKSYQRKGYSKLYEQSTAVSDTGKIVTGKQFRTEERKESARKGARTRREKRSLKKFIDQQREEYYDNIDDWDDEEYRRQKWEEERRQQDEYDRANANLYREGEIAYNEILELIDKYPTKGALRLKQSLASEIQKYGRDNVLKAIGASPSEAISNAKQIIYYEEDADAIHGAFLDFYGLISGTVPSDEEAKELGDTLDDMTDFESR